MTRSIYITELQDVCLYIINLAKNYSISMHEICLFMYETGCRLSEVTDKNNILFASNNICTILPKKYSEPRNIYLNNFYPFLINYHSNNFTDISIIADVTIKKFIRQCLISYGLNSTDREIASRIFRYHFAQSKQQKGSSVEEIKTIMGHKEIKNTYAYLKPIYSTNPPR